MSMVMVTGGSGMVGGNIVRLLTQEGHQVIIIDNRRDTRLIPDIVDSKSIQFVPADIMDLPALIETAQKFKVENIIHMAAALGSWFDSHPTMSYQVNLGGTLNILETARITGVRRVVMASTRGVLGSLEGTKYAYPTYEHVNEEYHDPDRPYSVMKLASEYMGRVYKKNGWTDVAAMRFADFFGPERIVKGSKRKADAVNRIIVDAYKGAKISIASSGKEVFDLVYIKDISRGVVLASFAKELKHPVYNIGSGSGYSMNEIANTIMKVFPKAKIELSENPSGSFASDGGFCVLDIGRARQDFGYKPEYSFEEGLRQFVKDLEKLVHYGLDISGKQPTTSLSA